MKAALYLLVSILIQLLLVFQCILHPEEYPNLLAGSFTDGNRFSTGNTLPLVGYPWGFNHWSPQTRHAGRNTGSWWFSGSEDTLTWIRCTHQPSPWIGDWGNFLFTPIVGEGVRDPTHFWQPRGAVLKPYLMDMILAPLNIKLELTPSEHGAMLRVTFPETTEFGPKRICFADLRWDSHGDLSSGGGHYFTAHSNNVHSERMIVANFNLHVRVESPLAQFVQDIEDLRCFRYHPAATTVTIKMATSLISENQALISLKREMPDKMSFEEVRDTAKMVWNRLMTRVNVLDTSIDSQSEQSSRHLTIFYTGLYRALTFPRRLDEVDGSGRRYHYSPYDPAGGIHDGYLVTDNGFWDTFRTVYPLLSLIYPDHLGYIIQGWLNAYKEGGWLPSWASPGYRNCMVGTFADVVISDAIVKNINHFDLHLAVEALSRDAFEPAPRYGGVGKEGLNEYVDKGYLPVENGGEVVSRTLDYGFADYSTALAFLYLIRDKTHEMRKVDFLEINPQLKDELHQKALRLIKRAFRAFESSFDASRGLMVPKDRGGHLPNRFSALEWGKGFTEGNSWHHSFPPYAVSCMLIDGKSIRGSDAWMKEASCVTSAGNGGSGGLPGLHGNSNANLLKQINTMFTLPSHFQVGSYGQEIHEMTEARAVAMGQYAHNNQPVHHILFLPALLGDIELTQRKTRFVMERQYGIDFYAGDEDNGEQGAWFVLAAVGLFSVTPGTPDYVLGSPLFRHVRISRYSADDNKKKPFNAFETIDFHALEQEEKSEFWFDIFALGTSPTSIISTSIYLNKVLINNKKQKLFSKNQNSVSDFHLQKHGMLQFIMEGEEEQSEVKSHEEAEYLHGIDSQQLEEMKHRMFLLPSKQAAEKSTTLKAVEPCKPQQEEAILLLGESKRAAKKLRSRRGGQEEGAKTNKETETSTSSWFQVIVIEVIFIIACFLAYFASLFLFPSSSQSREGIVSRIRLLCSSMFAGSKPQSLTV